MHKHGGIFNWQSDCKRQTDVTTFFLGGEGGHFILFAPGRQKP